MSVRFSSIHKVVVYFIIGFVFTSACAPASANVGASPQPLSACPTPLRESNPYYSHQISPFVQSIYVDFRNGSPVAKQFALMQLGKNLEHWSDHKDIRGTDNTMVRVVVTYLEPVLIQYIVLNYVLSLPVGTDVEILKQRIRNETEKIIQRDELMFLVSITSPSQSQQIYSGKSLFVQMPVKELTLINPADMRVVPSHFDRVLAEKIDISNGPVYGIVRYPFSVLFHDTCIGFVDQETTSLVLDLASFQLGDTTQYALYWNIPYQPLITQDDVYVIPAYDPNYLSRLGPIEMPPVPVGASNGIDETNSLYYWEEMGRYYWDVLVDENVH